MSQRKLILLSATFFITLFSYCQTKQMGIGLVTQKTQKLYWESGVAMDLTSTGLLYKKLHLKAAYVSSMLGSAIGSNAVKQNSFTMGANWHFRSKRAFQIFTGLNVGYFHSNLEVDLFKDLPHNSALIQLEGGTFYKFRLPLATALSLGYNFIHGNGIDKPGTLFPLFYQLKVFYEIRK